MNHVDSALMTDALPSVQRSLMAEMTPLSKSPMPSDCSCANVIVFAAM